MAQNRINYRVNKGSGSSGYSKERPRIKPNASSNAGYKRYSNKDNSSKPYSSKPYSNKPYSNKPYSKDKIASSANDSSLKESQLKGIFMRSSKYGRKLYTLNLVPGKRVYDELFFQYQGTEYREWNPMKSKLGAAILKGVSQIGIRPGSTVLYLGCSTGTTCSHVSDIIGMDGFLFGIDFSPKVMVDFVLLSEERKNTAPIVADCNKPEEYAMHVPKVDVIFQDIAQRNQVGIFLKNCDAFLKKGGFGLLVIKARSIDVVKDPKKIFKEVRDLLDKVITIVDYRELAPYEKDHCIFVVKSK